MNYKSTRGSAAVSASAAIVKGLAPDGGLYVPELFPTLGDAKSFIGLSYKERAKKVLSAFLRDFTPEEVEHCVNAAYTAEKFGSEEIAPLCRINESTHILELWHGPTCAFKDMALQILPHLLTVSMRKNGIEDEVAILVATSGDTGKAALEGFRDVDGTRVLVFFPRDGVSNIQRKQMVTQEGNNVGVAAVEGNFDDAQNGVKAIFTDAEYGAFLHENGIVLSSANSINWGRLVPQIVYYVSAWVSMTEKGELLEGEHFNVVVPTGNFGNILAAYYAKKMGVPIARLICASNANDVLTEFIHTGVYNRKRDFHLTISPSMDILISSNLERFLYDISDENAEKVTAWMESLKTEGGYRVDSETLVKMQDILWAGSCDDQATLSTIRETYEKYGYLADTHTAVALRVYEDYVKKTGDATKTVVASTASPYKFGQSVLGAIADSVPADDFEILSAIERKSGLPVPSALGELRNKPDRFSMTCPPDKMRDAVNTLLGI
ncbi:MAG: threonine synthase [Ruminococcaceae bacterium]|nr:threonine synthase [Oscillospiraceae bacterium]